MRPDLFLQIVSVEARKEMSYRVDFWINTLLGFLVEFGLAWFLVRAIFSASGQEVIGLYSVNGMVVYYAAVLLLAKIVRGPDFGGQVSEDVYEGGLNRYLLFPTSYFWFKYAQHVGALLPLILQALLFWLAFAFVLPVPDETRVTPLSVVLCIAATVMGNMLYFLMRYPLQLVSFWADNVWSLSVALRFVTGLLGGAMVPLALFPEWAGPIQAYLPFRFLFDLPARTLLGQVPPAEWARSMGLALVWCLALAAVARAVWRRGDLRYTGVGI